MIRVAIFTGHRSEWSHLEPIYNRLTSEEDFSVSLISVKSHQSAPETPHAVDFPPTSTLAETASAIGKGIVLIAAELAAIAPDFLLVYGDRSETFAAVVAATQAGIPTAHIEGGDITEGGCNDDTVRHAITKLSHLHFATTEFSAERLRLSGEEPWRIRVVGLPVLDMAGERTRATELRDRLRLSERPLIVYCEHPVAGKWTHAVRSMFALSRLIEDGYQVLAIWPNGDAGSRGIGMLLSRLQRHHPDRVRVVANLPRADYHGALAIAECVAGNSSAGIKESAAFSCPCVNIGERQAGRLRGNNVIDVPHDMDSIYTAIKSTWAGRYYPMESPYRALGAGKIIAETLRGLKQQRARILRKVAA